MLVFGCIKVLEDGFQQDSFVSDDFFDLGEVGSKHLVFFFCEGGFTLNGQHIVFSFSLIKELLINERTELIIVE
jgi:hypothetical protein